MNYALFFLAGGIIGILVQYYYATFSFRLQQALYQNYRELVGDTENDVYWAKHRNSLQYWQILRYFGTFSVGFCLILSLNDSVLTAFWWCCYLTFLFLISILDWKYQLIPLHFCLFLTALHLLTAAVFSLYFNAEQAIFGASLGFLLFFGIYTLSKLYYRREALGRGDYWLTMAIGATLHWQQFPFFIATACLSALCTALWFKWKKKPMEYIPFAPFLSLGGVLAFMFA